MTGGVNGHASAPQVLRPSSAATGPRIRPRPPAPAVTGEVVQLLIVLGVCVVLAVGTVSVLGALMGASP